jgi:flagellar hook-length control protein FliK
MTANRGGEALPTGEAASTQTSGGAVSSTTGTVSNTTASTNAFVPTGATGAAFTGQGAGATATAHQSTAQAQSQSAAAQQAVDQVKVKITQQASTGTDTIRIQLKPAEMGRVDVKMQVHDGRVTAHVTADNQDTLDALKADSRGLERALNDAGLKADSGSLSFSLRGDGGAQMAQGDGGSSGRGAASNPYGSKAHSLDDDLDMPLDVDVQRSQMAASRGGVDIRV